MAQNNAVNVVGLDFEDIKASLKTYLQAQSTLKDYNFDGSVLNTILDVLAYNTHYQAFYSNMVANEMFLDSSLLRPSVVSHAKQLNYVPSSTTCSKAVVDVVLTSPASSDTYLSRGTEFSGTNPAGTRYKFVNLDTVYANAGATAFNSVTLCEGTLRRITYIYNRDTRIGSYLIIPNNKADTGTLTVRVYKSVTDTSGITDVWANGEDYLTVDSTSQVYFLQEKDAGIYEVYFGDGILGAQPESGNVVMIEYLETNGSDANGVNAFTKSDPAINYIQFHPDSNGATDSVSYGGSDLEDITQIKYHAPKFYQTGNRAVTENDYAALVFKKYPNVSSVNVYGGETVVPPQYGKVFIAVKPKSGGVLTNSEKVALEQDIRKNNSVITITPKVIDPEYTDLVFDTTVTYNPGALSVSSGVLQTLVISYIFAYSRTKLEQFGQDFYYSQMLQGLNGIHTSILGVYSKIKMRKIVDAAVILKNRSHEFDFKNALYHPHDGHSSVIASNIFSHLDVAGVLRTDCTLQDDGSGILNILRPDPNSAGDYLTVYPSVGTVDYTNGVVRLNSKFVPDTTVNGTSAFPIIITVEPEITNIYANEHQILRINPAYTDSVSVTMRTETSAAALNSLK
jgi:hypothetical protein